MLSGREVSSTCLLQEPSRDTGSREPQGQPWAGQVFLSATAVQVQRPRQLRGLGLSAAASQADRKRSHRLVHQSPAHVSHYHLLSGKDNEFQSYNCLRIVGTVFRALADSYPKGLGGDWLSAL